MDEESCRLTQIMAERDKLLAAIRKHRDERGDSRCWLDDEELYKSLPEGYTPPARDTCVELERCRQYIASRHNPATEYVSPQHRIEELETEVARLQGEVKHLREGIMRDRTWDYQS